MVSFRFVCFFSTRLAHGKDILFEKINELRDMHDVVSDIMREGGWFCDITWYVIFADICSYYNINN